jgi:hypothetical protein
LLLRVAGKPLAEDALATLQHALARGLEIVYQLEESEIQAEPVPTRDNEDVVLAREEAPVSSIFTTLLLWREVCFRADLGQLSRVEVRLNFARVGR